MPDPQVADTPLPHRVLLTGPTGRIGRVLRSKLARRYALLRLGDNVAIGEVGPGEEPCRMDLRDPASLERACEGIDTVVHLAGQSIEADWPTIMEANIAGAYSLFEAARRQNVRRVIFASSHHAIGFYRREEVLDNAVPPRPDSRYGLSKAFGEALGRFYADKFGMSVACIRIGVCRTRPEDVRHLSIWISENDMARLIGCGIEAPAYHYLMLYGISANTRFFWTNPDAARIGYVPQDNAETYASDLGVPPQTESEVSAAFQGGYYCPPEFRGDPSRID
jgi:uronate dehydrogenase